MFYGMHFFEQERDSGDGESINPHQGWLKTLNLHASVNQLMGGT